MTGDTGLIGGFEHDLTAEEQLEGDLEIALEALRKTERQLKQMRDFTQWAFTPGSSLGFNRNEPSVRNIISAMQDDILNSLVAHIVRIEGDIIPF